MSQLNESFNIDGHWWIPNNPDQRIAGRLSFTPERTELELFGSFILDNQRQGLFQNAVRDANIINGTDTSGNSVTLRNCALVERTDTLGGGSKSIYRSSLLLLGRIFNNPEEIQVRRISCYFNQLDSWVNVSGFNLEHTENETAIRYRIPESIETTLDDGTRISIGFDVRFPTLTRPQNEMKIAQKAVMTITKTEAISIDDFFSIVNKLQNLLTLATGEIAYPLKLVASINPIVPPQQIRENEFQIFYNSWEPTIKSRKLYDFDILFSLNDIRNRFGEILNNWFNITERLEPVYNLYFATSNNPRLYVLNQFLNLVQALETYHRRHPDMRRTIRPEEEHQQRVNEILGRVPEHMDFLNWRLQNSNEPTLEERLTELLTRMQPVIENSSIGQLEPRIIVATRNYNTHFDERRREESLTGIELFNATRRLKVLLELYLLQDLGFDMTTLQMILQRIVTRRGI